MRYKVTFHEDIQRPYHATILPLDVLHPSIKEAIMDHEVDYSRWLQNNYSAIITTQYIYLYTLSGHRIDIWL